MSAQSIPQAQNWKTLSGLSNLIRSFSVNEDILPAVTLVYSLGSSAFRWLNLYAQNIFASDADIGTIDCTTLNVTGTATIAGINVTNITAAGILAGNSLSITTNGTINGNLTIGNDLVVMGSFDADALSCSSFVCTGSATVGGAFSATSISSSGSISGQAMSCTALTCTGAISAATISAPTLTVTGSTSLGNSTGVPVLVTSAGILTVQNTTDISLVNTNASITTVGGLYVAKSIRCDTTVRAVTYLGSGGISTTSNSTGFTQGTGLPSGSPVNFFSNTTQIGALLTCTSGLTVSSGTTTTGAITAGGLITCNAGLTVATGTTTTGVITAGGLITCNAGLTVATGTTTTQAVSASGLITCNAGLTVSAGTTTLGGATPLLINSTGAITAQNRISITSGGVSGSTNTGITINGDNATTKTLWDQQNSSAPNIYNVFSGDLTLQSFWGVSVNLNTGAVNPSFNAPQTRVANTSRFTINRRAVGAGSGVYDTIFSVDAISGLTSASTLTASGLITGSAGLTVSSGTCSFGSSTALTVSTAGILTVNNTTPSTSVFDGCAVYKGGIGVFGKVWATDFRTTSGGSLITDSIWCQNYYSIIETGDTTIDCNLIRACSAIVREGQTAPVADTWDTYANFVATFGGTAVVQVFVTNNSPSHPVFINPGTGWAYAGGGTPSISASGQSCLFYFVHALGLIYFVYFDS